LSRPSGRPLHRSTALHDFQRLTTRSGLARKSLYNLRHSHASLLIRDGATLMDVKKQLGHSQIHMTADTDDHLSDGKRAPSGWTRGVRRAVRRSNA